MCVCVSIAAHMQLETDKKLTVCDQGEDDMICWKDVWGNEEAGSRNYTSGEA